MTSHPVAKSAELVDQRRFKMDAWCHLYLGYTSDFLHALVTRQFSKKSHHNRKQKIARVAAALVSSLFSPTVNHDFVCCVLWMLQRYFASYFSQYFDKTNMLSIILTINDTQLRGMSCDFFALSKRVAFKISALVVSDSLNALIKIAYPEWNIMEKTLEVTV